MIDTRFRTLFESNVAPDEFFRRFVGTFAEVTGSELGLAWDCRKQPFAPICQALSSPEAMVKLPLSNQKHQSMLEDAWKSRTATMVSPPTPEDKPMPGIVISPLTRGDLPALVEFILPADYEREKNREIFQNLVHLCRLASESKAENTGPATTSVLAGSNFDDFAARIHESLDSRKTANNVANEARRLLDLDRVSVFTKQSRKMKATAISGQAEVNQRSNEVNTLRKLVDAVLETGTPFWYPTDADLPAQIEQPLNAHVSGSMVRSLAIMPIHAEPEVDETTPDAADADKQERELLGGIVFEHSRNQWDREQIEPGIQTVVRHAGCALRNANEIDRVPLYRALKTTSDWASVAFVRNLKRTTWILAGLAAVALLMIFLPWSFKLGCEGNLVPQSRQRVFSDQNATVRTVHVEHGDPVAKGDALLELENVELEIQIEQLTGELESIRERLAGSRSIRIRQRDDRQDASFNRKELQAQIDSLKKRLRKLHEQRDQLLVRSPINGQILTWDLENTLKDRSVAQGDMLVEVADTDGDWELELDLPDRKIGHLLRARRKADEPLPVTFTLAAEPGRRFSGTVREVATTTSLTSERLQVVRVRVDLDEADIEELKQAGTSVNASIGCGSRPLGFVMLHEVWEFLQYHLLFRIW